MRIGITGATGFIGSRLASLAHDHGHMVVAYTRGQRTVPAADIKLQQPGPSPHALPETPLDVLVHLAGESLMGLWTPDKKERIWKSRVDFTEAMVAHLSTWKPGHRPRTLICASGAGFYGDTGDRSVDENSPRGAGFLADVCAGWERAAHRAETLGMRIVTLRTGMVLGCEGGAFPLLRRVFGLGLGGRLGSGRQWTSWVHIDDAVQVMLRAATTESVRGPVNVCAPGGVTNAEFTQKLASALHRPAFLHAPAFALRLLLRGMAGEMLLSGQRTIPRAATEMGHVFQHPAIAGAFDALV